MGDLLRAVEGGLEKSNGRLKKKKHEEDQDDNEIIEWSKQYDNRKRVLEVVEEATEMRSKKNYDDDSSSGSSEKGRRRNVVSFSNEKETNSRITTPRHETASPKASSSKDKSNTRSDGKITLRYKSCPKCDAAVGESNHSNRITIYYDEETGEEDRRGHSG